MTSGLKVPDTQVKPKFQPLKSIKWYFKDMIIIYKRVFIDYLLSLIDKLIQDCNYIKHAKSEFIYAGYEPLNTCENGPNKWIQENVLQLLKILSFQGHSGVSIHYVVHYFSTLSKFDLLTPLTGEDNEWFDTGLGSLQNKRLSSVFKDDKNPVPHYIDAIVWKTESGSNWHGKATLIIDGKKEIISSSQNIKFPFTPKSFYVDVIDYDDSDPDNEGFIIKDINQLKEVFEYYLLPDGLILPEEEKCQIKSIQN